MNTIKEEKQLSRSTIWRHNLSPERLQEIKDKNRDKINEQLAILTKRYKDMTPEEKREYNHARYLRKKEEYKRRSREQYARLKAGCSMTNDKADV